MDGCAMSGVVPALDVGNRRDAETLSRNVGRRSFTGLIIDTVSNVVVEYAKNVFLLWQNCLVLNWIVDRR